MKDWTPCQKANLAFSELEIDAEEGFVLSRIDGSTTVAQLAQLTGLPVEKVEKSLGRLMEQGALQAEDPEPDDEEASPDGREVMTGLPSAGVDLDKVTDELVVEGIAKFVKPFDALLEALETKRKALAGQS